MASKKKIEKATKAAESSPSAASTRKQLSQSDVPAYSLDKALAVAKAIGDNYAFSPATPLDVASALELTPTTGGFRMLTGASLAYGLTTGSYSASEIAITPLGMRIVRPLTDDGDDDRARKEAVLAPKIVGDFLRKYDGAALPKDDIARNVLHSMGVPLERTGDALPIILENAKLAGLLRLINDKQYVDLKGASKGSAIGDAVGFIGSRPTTAVEDEDSEQPGSEPDEHVPPPTGANAKRTKRVFITHGKNRTLIEPIRKLLKFGDLEAVVSVQAQTVSQPVPGKIMEEMRSCGAAIILVENERTLIDADGNQHVVLNDNVLIEIGAAMALFGSRFILVVKDGVKLPSNLQGLLELRYKGETLDVSDTVSLLDAISDMKGRHLPQ